MSNKSNTKKSSKTSQSQLVFPIMLALIAVLFSFILTGCGNGGARAGFKALPKKFWEYEVCEEGDIRVGKEKYVKIHKFLETEKVWTKYSGVVVLPGEIDGVKVKEYPTFTGCKYVKKIVFPETTAVDDIFVGGYAEEVLLPSNVKSVTLMSNELKYLHIPKDCSWEKLEIWGGKMENLILPDCLKEVKLHSLPATLKNVSIGSKTKMLDFSFEAPHDSLSGPYEFGRDRRISGSCNVEKVVLPDDFKYIELRGLPKTLKSLSVSPNTVFMHEFGGTRGFDGPPSEGVKTKDFETLRARLKEEKRLDINYPTIDDSINREWLNMIKNLSVTRREL